MAGKLTVTSFLFLTPGLVSACGGIEPYLTEAQKIRYSEAVFDGTVESSAQVGVLNDAETLWEATVLLKSLGCVDVKKLNYSTG